MKSVVTLSNLPAGVDARTVEIARKFKALWGFRTEPKRGETMTANATRKRAQRERQLAEMPAKPKPPIRKAGRRRGMKLIKRSFKGAQSYAARHGLPFEWCPIQKRNIAMSL